ncbi:hypothetical protein, partial [Aquisalimonas asiatica]|uniref:hypothetical protein n=1 Tax=Aquisalimonas asiatica TaxID=406100 RepID=UPI001C0BBE92
MQADDRRFVFPYSNDAVSSALFAFFITALFSLVFLYLVFISYDGIMYDLSVNEASWHSLSVSFLLLAVQVLCFFVFSYSFLIAFSAIFRVIRRLFGNYPRLSLVFDRERGVVFLPPIGLGGYDEVPWESLVVVNFHMPKMYGGAFKVIKAFRPSDLRLITLNEDFPDEAMAFYSWYMDRSKPLPPDEVFDPYRERDEERRL